MNITESVNDGLKREFLIQIAAAKLDADVSDRLTELSGQIRMPGFRPGKVPVSLIAKTHGDAVYGEILQKAVNDAVQSTFEERSLRPATEPKVEITKAGKGEDLEFKVALEVLPDIEPADLAAIALEKLVAPVQDDEVETLLKGFAENRKTFDEVEGRVAEEGDAAVIDFVGRVDGEVFEGGSATDISLELGSGQFIPGFEGQLVGVKAGDTREVKVTFPMDYGVKELAGKDAVFDVVVKSVKVGKEAEVDDEFAKGFGLESLDALKAALREQVERQHSALTREKLKRDLLDRLAETHDFAVPQSLVDLELAQIERQAVEEDGEGEGSAEERKAKLDAEFRPIAERRVRLGLLLAEVGRRNNVQIKPEEVNRAIFEEARRYPGQERQVVEFFQKNPQAQAQIRAPLYEDKVVDYILDSAQVTERGVTLDELRQAQEETDAAAA